MTYKQFKEKKDFLDLSNKEFADIIGYSESAIKAWNRIGVPKWADIVIEHLTILNDINQKLNNYNIKR